MSSYKSEDIAGTIERPSGRILCRDCSDITEVEEDEIVTFEQFEKEEEIVFCDECKEKIC